MGVSNCNNENKSTCTRHASDAENIPLNHSSPADMGHWTWIPEGSGYWCPADF